ncbi:hypothetical protein BD289DRAFT_372679 [Coniella lustricola]|uniref:Uncharacterized protein n=1 Tax=Coniella lustricola TaxID=2025994 RepID=A0A2T3A1Z3_9PEZI|nr:hypothetical protein BD289DRAFT_372679 [Coniella lustricola]
MHDAPSLLEAPPLKRARTGDFLAGQHCLFGKSPSTPTQPTTFSDEILIQPKLVEDVESIHNFLSRRDSSPARHDGHGSKSRQSPAAISSNQPTSTELASNSGILTASPTPLATQNASSVIDKSESGRDNKKRRRTGPLNEEQRAKANLIRKIRACAECHKRRVACHPSHQNTTWEALEAKYGNGSGNGSSTNHPESASASPQGWTPAIGGHLREYQEVDGDIEVSPSPLEEQAMRKGRTPLPTAPRSAGANPTLRSSTMSRSRSAITGSTSHIHTLPDSGRYIAVEVLLLSWAMDLDNEVGQCIDDLHKILSNRYNANCVVEEIPSLPEAFASYRWLSDRIRNFVRQNDHREVLKIIYYNGQAHLDRHGNMLLTDSSMPWHNTAVRWPPLQAELEESSSDILVLMDCPYFANNIRKSRGVLEILASASFDDFPDCPMPRCAFTKALVNALQTHAGRPLSSHISPISVTDLQVCLMTQYPRIVPDVRRNVQLLYTFPIPSPVHVLAKAENAMAVSIQLFPLLPARPQKRTDGVRRVNISLHLDADADLEPLRELFRLKPDSVRHVQIEDDGPVME